MSVRILYFAALREMMGRSEADCEISAGETVSEVARRVLGSDRNILFAVNDEMVGRDYELRDGDCLAFIPPVAGRMTMLIKLTKDPIDVSEALQAVRHPGCGAVTMFEGDVRQSSHGAAVLCLEYEAYEGLLRSVMETIVGEMQTQWRIHGFAMIQRVGALQVGDIGIAICVSSAHRRDALDALSYAIEEVKKRAPVWKKETTENGVRWINWESIAESAGTQKD